MVSLTGRTDTETALKIASGGFWPALKLEELFSHYHVAAGYNVDLLKNELAIALSRVLPLLKPVSDAYEHYDDLKQITITVTQGGESESTGDIDAHWRSAVFSQTRAQLVPLFRAMSRKDMADAQIDRGETEEAHWKTQSLGSIEYILQRALPELDIAPPASTGGYAVETI